MCLNEICVLASLLKGGPSLLNEKVSEYHYAPRLTSKRCELVFLLMRPIFMEGEKYKVSKSTIFLNEKCVQASIMYVEPI